MNKSKAKGTAWETAIVNYLRTHGHPFAERRALHGSKDVGDILLPGLIIEAKDCGRLELGNWIDQTNRQVVHAAVPFGVVWAKRRGFASPGKGYVLMDGEMFARWAE